MSTFMRGLLIDAYQVQDKAEAKGRVVRRDAQLARISKGCPCMAALQ
jgi:hypothetical protein